MGRPRHRLIGKEAALPARRRPVNIGGMTGMNPTTPAPPIGYFAGIEPRMRYWAAYQFLFGSPNRWMNLLFVAVCMLIPFVGPVVLIGYLIEVLTPRLDGEWPGWAGPAADYPDFTFNRFGDYLKRGLWPFLVNFVVMAVASLPLGVLWFVGFIGIMAAGRNGGLVAFLLVGLVLVFMAGLAAATVLTVPPTMRAAFLQDFGPSFSLDWSKDFLARTWKKLALSALFLWATSIPLMVLGYAACFVGLYPAMGLLIVAQWHLHYQAYRVYLARGGVPLPVRWMPPAVPPPPPVPGGMA